MRQNKRQAGFTLLETILSLALTALIVGMIATMARQWLINWNRGADKIEQVEAVTLAENRLAIDLEGALAFPFHQDNPNPAFIGDPNQVLFLHEPTSHDGTERILVVRYVSSPDHGITRSIAIYDPTIPISSAAFSEPVTLLPAPYQFTLAYRDSDGRDRSEWRDRMLPDRMMIALTLPDGQHAKIQSIAIRTSIAASCARVLSMKDCSAAMQTGKTPASQPVQKKGTQNQIQDNTGKLQP